MATSRRAFVRGLGGFTLALPVLEGGLGRLESTAHAESTPWEPYAIFLRQANGCASAQHTEVGAEPERFWPASPGALTEASLDGRALDELRDHRHHLLAVRVNAAIFDYGDGHANGALQALTARPPVVPGVAGSSEASGESLDHRIGRELNPDHRDSLFLYAGHNDGWLGGACISYRDAGQRRAPLHNPLHAYQAIMGLGGEGTHELLVQRRQSVNDLVRDQMHDLLRNPRLSSRDVERLELHRAAIRDVEDTLTCQLQEDQEAALEGLHEAHDSDLGDQVLAAARAHMDVAALAVACGYTRAVAIQVGNGNDSMTRYTDPDTGALMENYHFISHRRHSHGDSGAIMPGSDLLHHKIDRQFASTFGHLLGRLEQYQLPEGSLLDAGVSVWLNDNGQGPSHTAYGLPYILAGSAGGYFRQGEYIEAHGEGTHCQLLNMIGAAVGLRSPGGGELNDFGDPGLPKHPIPELRA